MKSLRAEQVSCTMTDRPLLVLAQTGSRKRNRKSRRNGFVKLVERAMFVAAAVGLVWFGFNSVASSVENQASSVSSAAITVAPGQTLWQIAASLNSSGEQQIDIVSQIRAMNPSLSAGQALSAGEIIRVPISNDGQAADLHLARAIDPVNKSI